MTFRRIAPMLVCVAVFYTALVAVRLEQHDISWFVHLGSGFVTASDTSHVISRLRWDGPVGYDGQYYFGVAADPAHAHDYMDGKAGLVYSRVLYPALAYVASFGSASALPYAMLAINLLAVGAGTLAVALWLRRRGLSPWLAALYGLYPGLIFTVFRDLTEPLAFALAAWAVLLFHTQSTRRLVAAAALFALAALTRETTLPFALAAAGCLAVADRRRGLRVRSWRLWRRAALFASATCAPLLVWRVIVGAYLHQPTQETGHGWDWLVPLRGFWPGWPFDGQHRVILLTVVLPALFAAAGAIVLLRGSRARIAAALLLVNVLLYVVFLPRGVYLDYAAASRAAIGVVLASLYCLPAWWDASLRWRALVVGGAFAWSLAWFLFAAWRYGLPALDLITT